VVVKNSQALGQESTEQDKPHHIKLAHHRQIRTNGFDVIAGSLGSVYKPYKSKVVEDVEARIAEKKQKREDMAAKTAEENKKA